MTIIIEIRPVQISDGPFLRNMLYEMVYFPERAKKPTQDEILRLPEIYKYLDGFGYKAADSGLVAEDSVEGVIGAAWYRLFDKQNKGYGYIADDIPELAIAVVPSHRGGGIGSRLLRNLVKQAKQGGHPALSLSVDPGNPACRLYHREGFRRVGELQTSWIMKLEI